MGQHARVEEARQCLGRKLQRCAVIREGPSASHIADGGVLAETVEGVGQAGPTRIPIKRWA